MTIDELIAFSKLLKEYKQMRKAIEDIKTEIEQHCSITVGADNEPAMTLHDIFEIFDKHISEVGTSKSLPEGSKE